MKAHYTDDELIELVETLGDSTNCYFVVADKIRERFAQKDRTIAFQNDRIDAAAKYMGHNLITELLEEGY